MTEQTAGQSRGSALRGAERGEGDPASDEPGCGAEPHVIEEQPF